MEFGKRLKELRRQAGLTQQQLGTQIGVTKSVISFYELQERSPAPDVLIKLAAVFHVTTDYLLGIEKSQTIDVSGLTSDVSGLTSDDIQLVYHLVETLRQKNTCAGIK